MTNQNDPKVKPTTTNESATSNKKPGLRDRAGDMIEKVGHTIAENGAPGLGKKIHDLGDKVESSHDDPNHPHDV
ncbi:MAG: hypothetical protein V4760_05600 [Bdellovibrionota bacterium]